MTRSARSLSVVGIRLQTLLLCWLASTARRQHCRRGHRPSSLVGHDEPDRHRRLHADSSGETSGYSRRLPEHQPPRTTPIMYEKRGQLQPAVRRDRLASSARLGAGARPLLAQAERRVLHGESVPASAKLVSLFEPHTAIVRRGKEASRGESDLINACHCAAKCTPCTRVATRDWPRRCGCLNSNGC
jgi:hypothetical protein